LFWYLLAKLFEYFDHNIFSLGHWLSGHSLKHLAAAMVPGVLLYSLTRRR
jgi:hypothetical protein